ncbi:C-type lectin domain family 4 member A isoform X3 [Eptesicus fuscus]|uniref:C-type lectin domain family 4 member A isoform X3 n=1 Tax=Eptesicus fuscus TaxID=29078 RepID=UPI002403FAB8|nr:C-type lectin domain family 4 member A isoform X3 [Eptesicus fuscus]
MDVLRKRYQGFFEESRRSLLNMTSEITYAEVKFKNESTSLGTKSEPSAAPKEKTSLHKTNPGFPKALLPSLLILLLLLAISFFIAFIKKDWSCCPKNWKPFNLNCYFISNDTRNWTESKNNCSAMKSHLLVINTKEEQDFIIGNLDEKSAYYVGLSDPEGNGAWQWVDQTPYNASATFWRPGEPNSLSEHCVILNKPPRSSWGWNDVTCKELHRSICKMMKIYL